MISPLATRDRVARRGPCIVGPDAGYNTGIFSTLPSLLRVRPNSRNVPCVEHAQIVRRAVEYFSAHGFGVGTRELAKHIGVTQPLLYHYFGSKEKLVERVYREVFFSR